MPVSRSIRDALMNQGQFTVLVNGQPPIFQIKGGQEELDLHRRITAVELEYAKDKVPVARVNIVDPYFDLLNLNLEGSQWTVSIGYMKWPNLLAITGYPRLELKEFPQENVPSFTISVYGADSSLEQTLSTISLSGAVGLGTGQFLGRAGIDPYTPVGLGDPIDSYSINKLFKLLIEEAHGYRCEFVGLDPDQMMAFYINQLVGVEGPGLSEDYGRMDPQYYTKPASQLRKGDYPNLPMRDAQETDLEYIIRILDYLTKLHKAVLWLQHHVDHSWEEWDYEVQDATFYIGLKKDLPFYQRSLKIPAFGYRTLNHACLQASVTVRSQTQTQEQESIILDALGKARESIAPPSTPPEQADLFRRAPKASIESVKPGPATPTRSIDRVLATEIALIQQEHKTERLLRFQNLFKLVDVGPSGDVMLHRSAAVWELIGKDLKVETTLLGFPLMAGSPFALVGLPAAYLLETSSGPIPTQRKVELSRVYVCTRAVHHLDCSGLWTSRVEADGESLDGTADIAEAVARAISTGQAESDLINELTKRAR